MEEGDRMEPKKIKIPKVIENDYYSLEINRGDIIETVRGATRITCKRQIIEGIEIPKGLQIWLRDGYISNEFSGIAQFEIRGVDLNPILKKLYLDKLRLAYQKPDIKICLDKKI